MIGLATRGYLRRLQPPDVILVGDGPDIITATELRPEVRAASLGVQIAPPVISSAKSLVPIIQGGPSGQATPPPGSPTIVSGNLLVPVIQSGEEED